MANYWELQGMDLVVDPVRREVLTVALHMPARRPQAQGGPGAQSTAFRYCISGHLHSCEKFLHLMHSPCVHSSRAPVAEALPSVAEVALLFVPCGFSLALERKSVTGCTA